jgi:hypothetical protein
MGDETYFTIQVKGTAYRFKPIPPDDLAMVMTVVNMGASQTKSLKALGKVLADSAGPEQWDQIADRMVLREIPPAQLSEIFKAIIERQNEGPEAKKSARKRAGQPKGLDVAGRLPSAQ